jgi:hypothetical protein
MLLFDIKNKTIEEIKPSIVKNIKIKYLNNKIEFQEFYLVGLGENKNGTFELKKILKIPFDVILKEMEGKFCKVDFSSTYINKLHNKRDRKWKL